MNRARMSVLFVALAAIVSGCGSSTTVTTVAGDTVTNAGGIGTGSIGGVKLEVRGLLTGEARLMPSVQTLAGPSGNYTRQFWEITLGEVTIQLERYADLPIEVTVDDNFYGKVQPGDELLIDENRAVFVNGVERATTARDFRDPIPAAAADGESTP